MKLPHLPLLATLFLAANAPATLSAQQIDTRRHIEASGAAKLHADVDLAIWHITLRGEAPVLADAAKSLEEATNGLKTRLLGAGVPREALRLSDIASGKHYEGEDAAKTFKGYYAERQTIIEIRDTGTRQTVETALLQDDRISITRVELLSTKHEENRRQALVLALNAAKTKAAFLAREAGAELGPVLSIREGADRWGNISRNNIDFGEENVSSDFTRLEYNAEITLKFELK